MSYWGNLMAEQDEADALFYMGEAEWRDTFEDRHGWAPDYDYEVRKTNVDDVSYRYANPDVTKAFDILDGERRELMEDFEEKAKLTCEWETTTETENNE